MSPEIPKEPLVATKKPAPTEFEPPDEHTAKLQANVKERIAGKNLTEVQQACIILSCMLELNGLKIKAGTPAEDQEAMEALMPGLMYDKTTFMQSIQAYARAAGKLSTPMTLKEVCDLPLAPLQKPSKMRNGKYETTLEKLMREEIEKKK